jgi:Fe2+ transport system protein FeoA
MAVTLDQLKPGDKAKVIKLHCTGANRRRMMDFGILPGAKIDAELVSPLGAPIAYRIRDTLLSLRITILILTLTLGANNTSAEPGVLLELGGTETFSVLTDLGSWTLLTAVNLMLFSLLHKPCSTTLLTIWNETRSRKWTLVAALLPIAIGVTVTLATTILAQLVT